MKRRYIVCLNEKEAERERLQREELLSQLERKLKMGQKSLIANRGYRRYIRAKGGGFEIAWEKAKQEARYDGKWVLLTNTELSAAEVAVSYKRLWEVERTFRDLKNILEVRPIYHWSEERVRGHVGVCFLALYLQRRFMKRLEAKGVEIGWADAIWELREIKVVRLRAEGAGSWWCRSEIKGRGMEILKAMGLRAGKRRWE